MIYVDTVRCTGCGECVDACSAGAIALQEGVAFIDEQLCKACEACLSVCQVGAILAVEPVELNDCQPIKPMPMPVQVQPATLPVSLRGLLRPAFGAALLWTGRELLPRLAELALDRLSQRNQPVQRLIGLSPQPSAQPAGWGPGSRRRRQGRRHRQQYQNRKR